MQSHRIVTLILIMGVLFPTICDATTHDRSEIKNMVLTTVILLAFFVIPLFVLAYIVGKRGRFFCQRCGAKVLGLSDMDETSQDAVMSFFRRVESRAPDEGMIYACPDCKSVYDDFSGERRSRDQDLYYLTAFCKSCGGLMHTEGADSDTIRCNHCATTHVWRTDEASGYSYLTLEAGGPVRVKAVDYSLGGG